MDDNFSESGFNKDVPLRNTNSEGEKSYTSSPKSSLRSHLNMHDREKLEKV